MVVIAGYREVEFFISKLAEIKEQLLSALQNYWITNPSNKENFFSMLPDLLYNYLMRVDDLLGIHGSEKNRSKYPKIPFALLEHP